MILERRSALGPGEFVFGSAPGAYQPNIQTAWETLRLANDIDPKPGRNERNGIENSLSESTLAGTTCGMTARAGCSRTASTSVSFTLMLAHASCPANPTLPERDGRGTQERTGGELEQQRPTASPCGRKLIGLVSLPVVPVLSPGT